MGGAWHLVQIGIKSMCPHISLAGPPNSLISRLIEHRIWDEYHALNGQKDLVGGARDDRA